MAPAHIARVKESFAKVEPISDTAAEIFYRRLFEIAPHVRPHFKGDMVAQGQKLMTALSVVVNGLNDSRKIVPVAEQLAIHHVNYGVKPEDYAHVGEALIYKLQTGLGDAFTEEIKAGWIEAYAFLSSVMIAAAYQEAPQ